MTVYDTAADQKVFQSFVKQQQKVSSWTECQKVRKNWSTEILFVVLETSLAADYGLSGSVSPQLLPFFFYLWAAVTSDVGSIKFILSPNVLCVAAGRCPDAVWTRVHWSTGHHHAVHIPPVSIQCFPWVTRSSVSSSRLCWWTFYSSFHKPWMTCGLVYFKLTQVFRFLWFCEKQTDDQQLVN